MRKLYVLLLALLLVFNGMAQISVAVTGNTNTTPNLQASYTSLSAALAALNAVTAMSGPVVLTCAAGGSETAPAAGLTIGSTSLNNVLTATRTVTLTKAGGLVTLNAGVGVATPSSATMDGILKIVGADYVTVDGLTFRDNNTTNPATMEYGIGLFKASAANGAQNNTIQNCTISLPRLNNAAGAAPMFDGSVGILVINATATAAGTSLTPTGAAGTNSFNKIYSNSITGGNTGIGLSGYAATTGYPLPTLGDVNNDIGGAGSPGVATGNSVLNYGGGAAANAAAGIRAANQWGLNISNNVVNNNNGSGVNHGTTLRGIYAQSGNGANVTISYNTISVKSAADDEALMAIENAIGTIASNTASITNNRIENCTYTTATSGDFTGIYNNTPDGTVNINSNQIINNSVGAAGINPACSFTGIWATSSPNTVNINNNTVSGNTVNNNAGVIHCIRGGSANTTISSNTISNNSIPTSSGGSAATILGIYNSTSPTAENYTNNNIYNLSITGNSTASTNVIYGIYNETGANPVIVNGNNVNNLSFSSTASGSATVAGIRIAYGTNVSVAKNVVHALSSTGSSPTVAGIYAGSSAITTMNVVNNIIGNLATPASTGHNLFGLYAGSSGTNLNFFYNTVFLNATSTGSGFSSSAIYMSSNSPTVTLRNNLLTNLSSATGSGITSVVRRPNSSLTGYGNASNNNLLYAGPSSS
ncbi:MAG TPA: hypothetical protein VM871_04680, partial [Flavisolibacter sp.]|nr:hypothetical protein [Flavisolibacter sp.]